MQASAKTAIARGRRAEERAAGGGFITLYQKELADHFRSARFKLLFALLQAFCLPEEHEEPAPAEKCPKHGKKAKPAAPAEQPGLVQLWLPPIAAAIVMMAVCGAISRVIFGFLF